MPAFNLKTKWAGGAITPRSCDAQLTGLNSAGAQLVVRGGVAACGDG